jgi:hypothetical protein
MNIKLIGGPADGVVLKAARQRNDWVWQHNGRNFYYRLQSRAHAGLSESTDSTEPVPFVFHDAMAAEEADTSQPVHPENHSKGTHCVSESTSSKTAQPFSRT